MKFKKHIFICTNERKTSERKSCGEAHGLELVLLLKKMVKDKALNVDVRAQRSGCLDACDFGPSIVVYPDGVYYGAVSTNEIEEIFTEHILNDRPVERLRIKFPNSIS